MDYLGVKPKAAERWRGWAVIQTGCSNYCTYCVVPFSRGREKNRPMKAILKEVRELVNGGAKEINLLGQAVNGWRAPDPHNFSKNNPFCQKKCLAEFGAVAPNSADSKIAKITKPLTVANDFVIDKSNGIDKKNDFEALLWEVNRIEGINRVGFYSAHPMYMNDATIKALKLPKMMNYLHLPVQSGNNEILKKMNRNYTREEYLKVIHRVKKARPELALATDIIVGFPGETKRQFADTVSLYKKCDFDMSYNAMYSPRTGTAAFGAFPDDVPQEEKRRRWRVLQNLMEKNVLRKNKKFLKKTVEVLVDGCRPAAHGSGGVNWGFSREYKKVSFSGNPDLIGQVVNVKINKVQEWELEGIIAN